jgi:hypothetical protein
LTFPERPVNAQVIIDARKDNGDSIYYQLTDNGLASGVLPFQLRHVVVVGTIFPVGCRSPKEQRRPDYGETCPARDMRNTQDRSKPQRPPPEINTDITSTSRP